MRKAITCFISLLLSLTAYGQQKIVVLDYQHNLFNDEEPLPADAYFTIKGSVDQDISIVTLAIFKNHRQGDTLYAASWRRPEGNSSNTFWIPVYFKLRNNSQYDLVFHFYQEVPDSARTFLSKAIRDHLEAYIKSSMSVNSRRISFRSPVKTMLSDMDQIVLSAFTYYKNTLPGSFPGFSDLVENKLKQLNDMKITQARYNIKHRYGQETSQIRQQYAEKLQQQLLTTAMSEVAPYINGHLSLLEDVRERNHYPTESNPHSLAINAGYGALYLSGHWGNLYYDSGPYAGLSFPLGNESHSSFWGNTSVSIGVFLRNFKDKDGNKITGPVVGLPYYVGLGYKFLNILRFQAGMAVTSTKTISNIQNIKTEDVQLKPFVGLSAEINLWLGFSKKQIVK